MLSGTTTTAETIELCINGVAGRRYNLLPGVRQEESDQPNKMVENTPQDLLVFGMYIAGKQRETKASVGHFIRGIIAPDENGELSVAFYSSTNQGEGGYEFESEIVGVLGPLGTKFVVDIINNTQLRIRITQAVPDVIFDWKATIFDVF